MLSFLNILYMIRIETLEKHTRFLEFLQSEITKHNGNVNVYDIAKENRIGAGHMGAYKSAGFFKKISSNGRHAVYEFKSGLIEPIQVRNILNKYNDNVYTKVSPFGNTSSVSKNNGVTMKKIETIVEPKIIEPKITVMQDNKRKPRAKKQDLGLIRRFIKWIY